MGDEIKEVFMKKYGIYLVLVMVSVSGLNAGKGGAVAAGVLGGLALGGIISRGYSDSQPTTIIREVPSESVQNQKPQTVVIERAGKSKDVVGDGVSKNGEIVEVGGKKYLLWDGDAYPVV